MLEIKISVESVDYSNIIDKVLPIAIDRLSNREDSGFIVQLLSKLQGLSVTALKAALAVMPQNVKDELAVSCLQYYKNDITSYINKLAIDKDIKMSITDVNIDKI